MPKMTVIEPILRRLGSGIFTHVALNGFVAQAPGGTVRQE